MCTAWATVRTCIAPLVLHLGFRMYIGRLSVHSFVIKAKGSPMSIALSGLVKNQYICYRSLWSRYGTDGFLGPE